LAAIVGTIQNWTSSSSYSEGSAADASKSEVEVLSFLLSQDMSSVPLTFWLPQISELKIKVH
jgi:hypothetical protein